MKRFITYWILLTGVFQFSLLNGQEVTVLDQFEPYEWIGDTLYFNRNQYDYVVTRNIDTSERYPYKTNFYILKDLKDLQYTSDFDRFRYQYYIRNAIKNTFNQDLFTKYTWKSVSASRKNFVKIKKTKADYYMDEKAILLPGVLPDTSQVTVDLPLKLFTILDAPLDSFYQHLHFGNMESYTLHLSYKDSLDAKLNFSEICNPVNHSNKTILTKQELTQLFYKYVENIHFPSLKVDDQLIKYKLQITIGVIDYQNSRIKTEMENNFKNSMKVFEDNDSLLAIVDSFNNRTILYVPGLWDKAYPEMGVYSTYHLLDIHKKDLVDITGDGIKDLVIDTSFRNNSNISTVGDVYTIGYIPNASSISTYISGIVKERIYTKYLGNNYYYLARDNNNASIYYAKDNIEYRVLTLENNLINKKEERSATLYTHTFGNKRPDLTGTLKYWTKKGRIKREQMIRLIQSYVDHPEKLPVDFPMN